MPEISFGMDRTEEFNRNLLQTKWESELINSEIEVALSVRKLVLDCMIILNRD